jgi:four helix bundle protein
MHNDSSSRNLKVWQLAMVLVEDVYRVTTAFPVQERFGLTSQLRRAAVSVPSNVGEGKRRKRQKAFAHHLDIALGSQGELEVQLEIAKRVGFLRDKHYARLQSQTEEVGRMLNGLLSSIQDQLEY